MPRIFAPARRLVALWTVATLTASCASAPREAPKGFPPGPPFLAPVALPNPRLGADARLALAEHRAAAVEANARLARSAEWYQTLRQSYGGQQ